MRPRHLDVDRAGFQDLAHQFVGFLRRQFRPLALGDVDAGDDEPSLAGRAIGDEEPAAIRVPKLLLPKFTPVLRPLGQPLVQLAARHRELVALRRNAQKVEPVDARDKSVGALGMHLPVPAVGQHKAIILVIESETLGQRLDRVDQPVVCLPRLFLRDRSCR